MLLLSAKTWRSFRSDANTYSIQIELEAFEVPHFEPSICSLNAMKHSHLALRALSNDPEALILLHTIRIKTV